MSELPLDENIIKKLVNIHCVSNDVALIGILSYIRASGGHIAVNFQRTSQGELKQIWIQYDFRLITEEEYLKELRNQKVGKILDA